MTEAAKGVAAIVLAGVAAALLVGSILVALGLYWRSARVGLGFLYQRPAWARLNLQRS